MIAIKLLRTWRTSRPSRMPRTRFKPEPEHGRDTPQRSFWFGKRSEPFDQTSKVSLIRGGAVHPIRTSIGLPRPWHGGNC